MIHKKKQQTSYSIMALTHKLANALHVYHHGTLQMTHNWFGSFKEDNGSIKQCGK